MTDLEALADKLASLHVKASRGPWRKFSSIYGNATIAIMQGERPPENERWTELISWMGFDGVDIPKAQRHANARLIVELFNALPEIIPALRARAQAQEADRG